jgi:PAS domain S-box-containing protein
MAEDDVSRRHLDDLRQRAEEQLKNRSAGQDGVSPEQAQGLLHELQVHQIELEMQNEELRRAQVELEISRTKYFDLFDLAPVGYLTLSEKGLILEANLTASKLLGVERSSLVKRAITRFIFREDQDIYYLHRKQLIARSTPQTFELRMMQRESSPPFWVRVEATAVQAGESGSLVYKVVMSDITEGKKVEQERLELERRLLHLQKLESLGTLAGGIAHDFNNLLAVILGNLELALDRLSPDSSSRPRIDKAIQASARAAHLIRQMLAYTGNGSYATGNVNLSMLLQENINPLCAPIPKTTNLNLHLTHDVPSVLADASQLQQAVMNLITNAAEAIGETAGFITISTGTEIYKEKDLLKSRIDEKPSPGRFVYLDVADTGCGMDAETLNRLFEPFFTTKFTGRGLGMSAVLGIIRGHKGAIFVNSRVNKGTTIRIIFPVSETALPESVQPESTEAILPVRSGPSSVRRTILIVDDQDEVINFSKEMVTRSGYSVRTAVDGQEAVEAFQEYADEIDCVILDLTMPRMDGVATFKALKQIRPDVKVILSSGYSEKEVSERFTGKGLAGFIQKPYRYQQLREELERVLTFPDKQDV